MTHGRKYKTDCQIIVETLVSCCDARKPFRVADAEQKSNLIILFGLLSDCADGSWPPVHYKMSGLEWYELRGAASGGRLRLCPV